MIRTVAILLGTAAMAYFGTTIVRVLVRPAASASNAASRGAFLGKQVAVPPRGFFENLGFPICDHPDAKKVPIDVLRRTRFKDIPGYEGFLRENDATFRALRQELNPYIFEAVQRSRSCFDRHSPEGGTMAELEWTVTSNSREGVASGVRLRRFVGGREASHLAARSCMEELLAAGKEFRAKATARSGPFVEYAGLYPAALKVFFQQGVDVLTGIAVRTPAAE